MNTPLPRVAAWLLRVTVPERWADSITGDFEVEWGARRARSRWPRAAAAVITFDALVVAARFATERGGALAEALRRDVRESARALGRRPGYAAAAITVIALGVALNTTAFAIVDRVLLAPLPYHEPDRLVEVRGRAADGGEAREVSSVDVEVWREALGPIASLAAYQVEHVQVRAGAEPMPAPMAAAHVTPNLFAVLGLDAALGRTFTGTDGRLGAPGTAVIAGHVWRARFPGHADPIGLVIEVDGRSYTVIGVTPAGAEFPPGVGVWLARETAGARLRDMRIEFASLRAVARLLGPAGLASARAEFEQRGRAAAGAAGRDAAPVTLPLRDALAGTARRVLPLAWAAIGVVFVMACANAAGLLLARISARGRELRMRASLGASRVVIARHVAVEGVLLAVAGAAVGLALAAAMLRVFSRVEAGRVPLAAGAALDAGSFTFALALTLVAAVLIAGAATAGVLRPAARRWASGGVLVAGQLAICVALVVAAALTGAGLLTELRRDPGFDPDRLVVLSLQPHASLARRPNTAAAYQPLLDRLAAIDGIAAVAMTDHLPPVTPGRIAPILIEGESPAAAAGAPPVRLIGVTHGYFAAMRLPLEAGRDFTEGEVARGDAVAVIDARLAARAGGRDAIGRRLFVHGRLVEIVGIAREAQVGSPADAGDPVLYQPLGSGAFAAGAGTFLTELHLVVRSATDDDHVPAAVHTAVLGAADVVRPTGVTTLADRMWATLAAPAFHTTVFGVLAVLGGLLAALGVYGLVSHVVQQSTRELGIRLALGATRAHIAALVARRGLAVAASGLAAGLVIAPAVAAVAANRLDGAAAPDAGVYAATAIGVLLIVTAGCVSPAWRAMRVDPVNTLKSE